MKTRRGFKGSWQFLTAAALLTAAVSAAALRPYAAEGQAKGAQQNAGAASASTDGRQERKPQEVAAKQLKIDLGKSVKVKLPEPEDELKPATFRTPDGKKGWVVRIPGGLPLATPAYCERTPVRRRRLRLERVLRLRRAHGRLVLEDEDGRRRADRRGRRGRPRRLQHGELHARRRQTRRPAR